MGSPYEHVGTNGRVSLLGLGGAGTFCRGYGRHCCLGCDAEGGNIRRLLSGWSKHGLVCNRGIDFRVKYRFRASCRVGRSGCEKRDGNGALGNDGMADPGLGMAVRSLLFQKPGIYHAGIPGETIRPAFAHDALADLACQLCFDKSRGNGFCRRYRVQDGIGDRIPENRRF